MERDWKSRFCGKERAGFELRGKAGWPLLNGFNGQGILCACGVYMFVCACLCVSDRERERKKKDRNNKPPNHPLNHTRSHKKNPNKTE